VKKELNILLVDDDDAIEAAIRFAVLRHAPSHHLYVAKNGKTGLEMLRGLPGVEEVPPENRVVLLDCHMPIMDGLQFLHELRADDHLKRTPVLMLTNSQDESDRNRAYDLGIAGFICKPATMKGFSDAVAALEEFLQIVELPS
jgi:CheY-like chemotaxis protein